MHLMIEGTEAKDQRALIDKLDGPFRTMGEKVKPDEVGAPAWWHGEEEAFETVQLAMMNLPQRGR